VGRSCPFRLLDRSDSIIKIRRPHELCSLFQIGNIFPKIHVVNEVFALKHYEIKPVVKILKLKLIFRVERPVILHSYARGLKYLVECSLSPGRIILLINNYGFPILIISGRNVIALVFSKSVSLQIELDPMVLKDHDQSSTILRPLRIKACVEGLIQVKIWEASERKVVPWPRG